jgi:hypothetical protein
VVAFQLIHLKGMAMSGDNVRRQNYDVINASETLAKLRAVLSGSLALDMCRFWIADDVRKMTVWMFQKSQRLIKLPGSLPPFISNSQFLKHISLSFTLRAVSKKKGKDRLYSS